jgi:ABC-2 type transport system permease protein
MADNARREIARPGDTAYRSGLRKQTQAVSGRKPLRDPDLLATLTIIAFALVSTSGAMLLGALVSNDQQAGGISTALGLGLAALGGCMFPLAVLEMLSDTVYRVALVTPHAWALEALQALVTEDSGVADIAGFLLILVGYAVVLGLLATRRLRKVLVR